jgi:diguanylate cyclase
VMETACAEAMKWPEPSRIAINLSPKLFMEPDLPDRVAVILARTGLPPDRLVLEVTEGVLIDNSQNALAAMSSLKNQGILIALDDFGTGYASFGYLRRFPFDSIKIDRSFIGTLCEDEESCAIVRAILTLAHSLRLKVIAEGVESEAQLHWLRAEGCGEVQGFLFAKPMPARQIGRFLANKARRSAEAPVPDVAD